MFLPDYPLRWNQSNSDTEADEEICIPQNADADVCFNILDGVPGLQVTTKNSSKWTPIACRTRSKSKLELGYMLELAFSYFMYPIYIIMMYMNSYKKKVLLILVRNNQQTLVSSLFTIRSSARRPNADIIRSLI